MNKYIGYKDRTECKKELSEIFKLQEKLNRIKGVSVQLRKYGSVRFNLITEHHNKLYDYDIDILVQKFDGNLQKLNDQIVKVISNNVNLQFVKRGSRVIKYKKENKYYVEFAIMIECDSTYKLLSIDKGKPILNEIIDLNRVFKKFQEFTSSEKVEFRKTYLKYKNNNKQKELSYQILKRAINDTKM